MSDYGHDLLFGAFITPVAHPTDRAVQLAQLSERAGLDLVTFQDHPYQPSFLDTWTLLSFVAARTERIRLAPNVANLPLREPAVLARAAASLDRLSGGRLALGLGAGAFWDAIEAMGGPRRSPGEAVEALEEAITVIRALWDVDERGGVRHQGRHYQVVGARRGPEPAHDVPVWVGAYKPRMLRLVGRTADGSLPSLSYLSGPDALRDMNEAIDEGAAEAGRDPRAVRRLLNIGPDDTDVELLAELALEHGVSTFILGSDQPTQIRAFAEEVAPAVRELVESTRRTGGAETAPVTATDRAGATASTGSTGDVTDAEGAAATDTVDEVSERGRLVAQHLVDVHDGLRSELNQVRALVQQVRQGAVGVDVARSEINQMTMRQHNWALGAYCESYCRIVTQHHSIEDQSIFPHLRSSDPSLGPVLDRLADDHRVIHDVLERLDRTLVDLVGGPGDHAPLDAVVDELTQTLLEHFEFEEEQLLGPLARHGMYPGQL